MADWTQIYQNPNTQAMFGGSVSPIPSPSVQPIGGWADAPELNISSQAPPRPQQPAQPVQPVGSPAAAPLGQPGADESGGLGQLLLTLLPLAFASQADHPNRAMSSYMHGVLQQKQQAEALQQQRAEQEGAMRLREQERVYKINSDFAQNMVKQDPWLMSDPDFLSAWQSGSVVDWARQSGWKPRPAEEEVDPWEDTKTVGGNVLRMGPDGKPQVVWAEPAAPATPAKTPEGKVTKIPSSDGTTHMVLLDETTGEIRKDYGLVKEAIDPMTFMMLSMTDPEAAQRYLKTGALPAGDSTQPPPNPNPEPNPNPNPEPNPNPNPESRQGNRNLQVIAEALVEESGGSIEAAKQKAKTHQHIPEDERSFIIDILNTMAQSSDKGS